MKNIIITSLLLFYASFSLTAQCDYTLELYDSFGDGWDGTIADVTINGTATMGSPFTISDVTSDFASFTLAGVSAGDIICVTVSGGSFFAEKEWGLIDANGNYVASVPTPVDGGEVCVTVTCPDPDAPCEVITLDLFDSFGDAWNGAAVDIVAGGETYQYTIFNSSGTTDESAASYEVCVPCGSTAELSYQGGTFDDENTFTFGDACSEGPSPAIGVVLCSESVAACPAPPPVVEEIPTMGEWGLIILGISFLILGVVSVRSRERAFA